MSALHTLPSAALPPGKATPGRTAPTVATEEISFAAVLTAQLGLPNSSESLALIAGSEHPRLEETAAPQVAADPQVSDPAATLPFVTVNLPVAPAQAIGEEEGKGGHPHSPIVTLLPGNGETLLPGKGETLLPSKGDTLSPGKAEVSIVPKASRPPVEMAEPVPASTLPANEGGPQPATFAAILQSLPASEAAPKQGHVSVAADDSPSSPQTSTLAVIPEPKADTAHRPSVLNASVPVPVQDSRWGERFSERVVWITGQQVQAAEIHVEPAHLGPIEVRISMINDQANLLITAPHAVARDAIQMSLPRLQDMLLDSGLALGHVAVGAHTAGDNQGRHGDGPQPPGAGPSEHGLEPESRQSNSALRRMSGLVDLFA